MGVLKDKGSTFVINPSTRTVNVPASNVVFGTVGENLSEQITFVCPKTIDGRDVTKRDLYYVAWVNAAGDPGTDELIIDHTENESVYFTWTVRDGLTAASGLVQFSIHFEDLPVTESEKPYHWCTTTCKNAKILESVNVALGKYKSIYVVGDTLVIEDYTLVQDRTLELNSESITPSGSLSIVENGNHDVREYAEVNVNVSCDHDLTNLKPENVKNGVDINGVTGTFVGDFENINLEIENNTDVEVGVKYTQFDGNGMTSIAMTGLMDGGTVRVFEVAKGGLILFFTDAYMNGLSISSNDIVRHGGKYVVIQANGRDKKLVINELEM